MMKFAKIMAKIGIVIGTGVIWLGFMIGLTVSSVWTGIKDLIDGYSAKMVICTYAEMITAVSEGFRDGLKEGFETIDKIGA